MAALGLIWLPLAVLQQIDAILNFATTQELVADVALLVVLLAFASAALAGTAVTLSKLLGRIGATSGMARTAAWMAVGVPIIFLCAWQFAFAIKLWLEQVLGIRLSTVGLPHRELWGLIPMVVIALLWRLFGRARLIQAVTEPVLRLRRPALLLTLVSVAYVAWQRPTIGSPALHEDENRAAAVAGSPDIFVFSLDALAAEDAAACGDGATPMPQLQKLAARSTCFTRHYAASNLTLPSTTTIETGTLPWTHWVVHGGRTATHLVNASIGHALQKAGYSTHAFIAAQGASPRLRGTYTGYDTVDTASSASYQMAFSNALQTFPDSRLLPGLFSAVLNLLFVIDIARLGSDSPYPPEHVYGPAIQLIKGHRQDRPLFVWMHTWPPHSPYLPPKSTRYRLLPPGQLDRFRDFLVDTGNFASTQQPVIDKRRLRYRETIMGADESLGHFLDELDRLGRLDDALVIVTTDHGESFERGVLGHGGEALHEAVIRIPLVIKLPRQRAGQIITIPTSQADIAPTVVDLVRGFTLPTAEGRSLRGALTGNPLPKVPVFSMALPKEGRFRPLKSGHYSVIDGADKLVCHLARQETCELYDLAADPGEQHDDSAARPDVVRRLHTLLVARMADAEALREHIFRAP